MTLIQTIILAVIQGITELFPVSSLGHTILISGYLGWSDLLKNENFIALIVCFHIGTTISLLIYFYKDWINILKAFFKSIIEGNISKSSDSWTAWLVITSTIPAAIIGVFFEGYFKKIFSNPIYASVFLLINGIILVFSENIIKKVYSRIKFEQMTLKQAILVGILQSFALFPGISRSGITMVASLKIGLNHKDAAKYSFLLGTPIITAAAIAEVPQILQVPSLDLKLILLGTFLSGVFAFISIKFLLKYFENRNLRPFGYYCILFGLISIIFFIFIK